MKACLNCQKEFEYKRAAAKFCSDKCRVAYNRKHPKEGVTKLQMQVLYNSILDAVNQINAKNGQPEAIAVVFKPQETPQQSNYNPVPKVAAEAIMRKYVADRMDLTCEEEYLSWLEKLNNDDRLSPKQKELVKNTH